MNPLDLYIEFKDNSSQLFMFKVNTIKEVNLWIEMNDV